MVVLNALTSDMALEEQVLQDVEAAWKQICGVDANSADFMKFEAREGAADNEGLA